MAGSVSHYLRTILINLQNPVDHRRKWDRAHFEKVAEDRLNNELESLRNARKEKETIKRELLRARDYTIHKKKAEEKIEEYNLDERMKQIAEEEEKMRAYRSEKKREKKRRSEDVDLVDDDVANAMGFGGFGKRSKK